jgi:hypothetical protein
MLDWLSRRGKNQTMPEYSGAREMPSRGVPSRCSEQEANEAFSARCDSIQRWLCESPRRPQGDSPLFVEILTGNAQSVLTIERTKQTHCMPVFSSPFRAADYVRTLLASDPSVAYLSSSPRELLAMFRDLREVGIDEFTLDRCPRCEAFCAISTASMTTTDDVINCWSIVKSIELAASSSFSTMRSQPHERSSSTLRVMCYSRPLHTLALKTQGCICPLATSLWHFMTPTCVMKQKRFFASSSSKNGSADSTLNHVGPTTIFSLRTQDYRRLVSEAKTWCCIFGDLFQTNQPQ